MRTNGFLCAVAAMALAVASAGARQSVGLVLSGGGAKGIAHIGVIQALEENGIPIDFVAGTSMGAIVGGLYAAGYSPQEMMRLIGSEEFGYWSTGRIAPADNFFFNDRISPELYSTSVALPGDTLARPVPFSVISPVSMNFAFMKLFAPFTAQCDGLFDNLFVPFRCVASDVAAKRKRVFDGGSLGDAIRSSMSFPIVFQPVTVDGSLMYDGGIYDNFPVDVMVRDFHPDIIIGVDVSASGRDATPDMMNQLENLIIQNENYDLPDSLGVKLRIDLDEFSLLDFPKADRIYAIGYRHALGAMGELKRRVTSRREASEVGGRRAGFKSRTPRLRFRSVTTCGGSRRQNEYIDYLFDRGHAADTFGVRHAREAYYSAVTSGQLQELMPYAAYDRRSGLFDLRLRANMRNSLHLGIGGFLTSATNSMLFLSAEYKKLNFRSIDAGLHGWIGQSYMAASADAGLHLRSGNPSALDLGVVVSRQNFYERANLFFRTDMPTFVTNVEAFARITYSLAAGRHGKVSAWVGAGMLDDKFHDGMASSGIGKDKCRYSLLQAAARYEFNTLNHQMYPTSGMNLSVTAMGVTGGYRFYPGGNAPGGNKVPTRWLQAELRAERYVGIGRNFAVGGEFDLLASGRKLPHDYSAAIVAASAYSPTPASYNLFNPELRAVSYGAIGITPVWMPLQRLQLRASARMFMPWQTIRREESGTGYVFGRKLHDPEFFGELTAAYVVGRATLSAYVNYVSASGPKWNFGISFGLFILAPKFLK